jgi:hypothetical protein
MTYRLVLKVWDNERYDYLLESFEFDMHGFITFTDGMGEKHIVREWIELVEVK